MKHCFIIIFIISLLCIDNRCNYIPDSFSVTDTTFTQYDKYLEFKLDSLYLFNTKLGHIVDFRGIHSCSLYVNGEINSVANDSIYARITNLKDTILSINDSILGRAELRVEDVINWKIPEYHFEYPQDFLLGVLFFEYIDSADYESITQTIDSSLSFTALQKEIIVTALNEMIGTAAFYNNYREYIVQEVLLQEISGEIDRFIHESIWLDSTGRLKAEPLTDYEKEALSWFYMHLIARYFGVAPGIRTFMLRTYPVAERIHTLLFERGPSENLLHTNRMKRFVGVSKSGVYQHSYIDPQGNVRTDFPQKKITDIPFLTGTNWNAPLLFWPDVPRIPYAMVDSLVLPGRAVLYYNKQLTDGDSARYDLKLFYPINGTVIQNSDPVRIIGSIIIKLGFINFYNAFNPLNAALFRAWDNEILVREVYVNGDEKVYKEKRRMISNDMVH